MNILRAWISLVIALTIGLGVSNAQPVRAAQRATRTPHIASALTPSEAEITKVTLSDASIDGPALWTTTNGVTRGVLAWTGPDAAPHLNVSLTSIGTKFTDKVTLAET